MKLVAVAVAVVGIGLSVAPVAAADPGPVYANCTEAREAGDTDIPMGDDAYWSDGDRDGDGIACESYTG
jgi:hypothetical protein